MLQFFCFLLIIVVAEIAAGVWAYSNSDKLEKYVQDTVRSTVQEEYGIVDTRTKTFDAIQKGVCESLRVAVQYHCCGRDLNLSLPTLWESI
jgi:CD81 antigen